jgi:hypothetical protein
VPEPPSDLLPLASVYDLREQQRAALMDGVNTRLIRFLLLEHAGGNWQAVEPGSFRFEGVQDEPSFASVVPVWSSAAA